MNKLNVLNYIRRWRIIEAIEADEMLRLSLIDKFQRTISAFKIGMGLELVKQREKTKEVKEVSSRWRLLKAQFNG